MDAKNEMTAINYSGAAIHNSITQSKSTYDGLMRRVKIVEKNSSGTVLSTKQHLWVGNAPTGHIPPGAAGMIGAAGFGGSGALIELAVGSPAAPVTSIIGGAAGSALGGIGGWPGTAYADWKGHYECQAN